MLFPNMVASYDYIVVGCGGIGSGAVYWLSRRAGARVLGLEQFNLGHDRGGSQDYSRIIRLTYHDEVYTKLVRAAYEAWHQVERESGIQLVYKCGSLNLARKGTNEGRCVEMYADSMEKQRISFERLNGVEIARKFPQITVGHETVGLYQKDGGLVDAANGNSAHIQLARGYGASIIDECQVTGVRRLGTNRIEVITSKGTFYCKRLIVTAGAWLNQVLGSFGVHIPITVTQEQVHYYATPHMKEFTKDRFPVFIYHGPSHDFYAMPIHGNTGAKLGIDAAGNPVTPETRTFEPCLKNEKVADDFIKQIVPKFYGPKLLSKTCLYTMPADRNFIIDDLATKGIPEVIFCCGAGHAYKFASLFGKILSELALDGRTPLDISPFTMMRPAITDPTFPKHFVMGRATSCGAQALAKL